MAGKMNLAIGGQALIEGVMIRSPHHIVMSVRTPRDTIETVGREYIPLSKRHILLNLPIVRGMVNFIEMMVIGIKALNWSSQKAFEDESDDATTTSSTAMLIVSFVISFAFVIVVFKYIPLLITNFIDQRSSLVREHWVLFNLIDGLLKITLFFSYVWIISKFKDIRRVFEYHGAEHKSIFAYEHDAELTPEVILKYQKEHPRCGTSFILIVFVISIVIYTLMPRYPEFLTNLALRIVLLPIIAGIAYEILKLAGKYQNSFFMRIVSLPGMWFQYVTTQEPDTKQIEVAVATLKRALALEEAFSAQSNDL